MDINQENISKFIEIGECELMDLNGGFWYNPFDPRCMPLPPTIPIGPIGQFPPVVVVY